MNGPSPLEPVGDIISTVLTNETRVLGHTRLVLTNEKRAFTCGFDPPRPKQVVSIAEDWFLRISCVSLAFTDFSYSRSA